MLTVTNAFSPHILPLHSQPRFGNNQHSLGAANHIQTQRLTTPNLQQNSNYYLGTPIPNFSHPSIYPQQTRLPSIASIPFHGVKSTTNVFSSAAPAYSFNRHFFEPNINSLPPVQQDLVEFNSAPLCRPKLKATAVTDMDILRCKEKHFEIAQINGRPSYQGCSVIKINNLSKGDATGDNVISFAHPRIIRIPFPGQSITVNVNEKKENNDIEVPSSEDFTENVHGKNSPRHENPKKSPNDLNSQPDIMTLPHTCTDASPEPTVMALRHSIESILNMNHECQTQRGDVSEDGNTSDVENFVVDEENERGEKVLSEEGDQDVNMSDRENDGAEHLIRDGNLSTNIHEHKDIGDENEAIANVKACEFASEEVFMNESSVTGIFHPMHSGQGSHDQDETNINVLIENSKNAILEPSGDQQYLDKCSDDISEPTSFLHSEHLKRLEGLLTKKSVDHFQKDEFFQAKMEILHSVSKSCKFISDGTEQSGLEGKCQLKGLLSKDCNSSTPLPVSSSGPLTNIHHCLPFSLCHVNTSQQSSQRQCCPPLPEKENQDIWSRVLNDKSQKSAFKPVIKNTHFPQSNNTHLDLQKSPKGIIQQTLPPLPPIPQISIGATKRPYISRTDAVTSGISISPSSLEEADNLDAISLLRFRSNSFQCPGSLPPSIPRSVDHRTNPDALSVWLTWLHNRNNPDQMRNDSLHPIHQPILSKAPPPPRYHCGDCNKTYSTFGGLSKHRQFHCALHVKKEFACKLCSKSYSSLGALKMHIRTHTLPCKCHICGKAFSRPWLLQGHVRTHTGEKPFRCNHCGRAFADRSNLRAHLQTHAEIKKYACVKCGKTFSRMSLLTKHSEGSCPANASPCI